MTKSQIKKIILAHGFEAANIQDIVIKNNERIIVSIQISSDQEIKLAEKRIKNIETEVKKQSSYQKVTIFLTKESPAKGQDDKKEQGASLKEKVGSFFKSKGGNAESESKKADKKDSKLGSQKAIKNVKNIILVASAKGGVGKSTLATNIASSFSKIGYKTALVDADIYGPSIAHLMNVDDKPVNKDGQILPIVKDGIKFISVANLIAKQAAGIWRAAMINKILNQLLLQTNWGFDDQEVDMMVVDMPPGTGDIYLSLAQNFAVNGALLVATPQSLCEIDLIRTIDCFRKLEVPIVGMIENMSHYVDDNGKKVAIFGESNVANIAKSNDIEMVASLEITPKVNVDNKQIYCQQYPGDNFSHNIGMACEKIISKLTD